MSRPPTAAVGIDVDSLGFYHQIHGLPAPELEHDPIYTIAVPRFFELIHRAGVPATFFLVAEDAQHHLDRFAGITATASEVANHSYAHDYRMSAGNEAEIEADFVRAETILAPLSPTGRIDGFRAPGYNVSRALLHVVAVRGYQYDSSLLPSPLYFAARAAMIACYAVAGRPSRSMVGRARAFAGPLAPYRTRPSAPWKKVTRGPIRELPIACDPITRTPLIGTSWVMMPAALRHALAKSAMSRLPCFNFELHAIDLLDHTDPGVSSELAAAQPDLRRPAREKIAAFESLFEMMRNEREVRTLAELATRF